LLKEEGRIGVDALSGVIVVTCLFYRYYFVSNLATVSYFMARNLLQKVKTESKKNVIDVFKQQPQSAWILTNGVEIEIPFEQLKVGDIIVVNAGGFIPADGTITDGIASIDQHILTGESQPAEKGVGEPVFASTVVLSGRIYISVDKAGEETVVAQIGQILNNTADFKPATQLRSEILTDKTVIPTLLVSGLSLPFIGPNGAVAILNSHYKYKMSIVAPISILNFITLMSQNQILIKDGRTLDLLNQIDTIVFDKTGTLTEEQPYVGQIHICSEYDENAVLIYAAAAEHKQAHPIAKAIIEEAKKRQLSLPKIDDAEYRMGHGLTVKIDQQIVRVGSIRFMEAEGIIMPPQMRNTWEDCHNQGHSLVMVAIAEQLIGAIELFPTVRPETKEIISYLRQRHHIKSMYIISGDHETPTKKLAQELGIDHYFAETLPENKADIIEQLQAEGKFVCFVGDGINDAIALKKSQVSISLRGASTVATDTAQIILMDGHLNKLVQLFDLADEFQTNMKTGFMTLLTPTFIGMIGALFFHFGLATTIILSYSGLSVGVINSMWPLIKHQQKKSPMSDDRLEK
jgi:Cu2+-exporting ATPase